MKKRILALLMIMGLTAAQLAGCGDASDLYEINEDALKTEDKADDKKVAKKEAVSSDASEEGYKYLNELFSIDIPEEVADIVMVDVSADRIDIFAKEWFDKGFGGLIFSLWAVELPKEYAGGPYEKIGELAGDDGDEYDMVRGFPTEMQWDYELDEMPEDIERLEDAADEIIASLTGASGYTYAAGAGTKGEDLYKDVLSEYVNALSNISEDTMFENGDISAEIYIAAASSEDDPLKDIGYAYKDINNDGIDELFIGVFANYEFKGVVYDIYTIVDREPVLVVTGTARDRYYAYDNYAIVNVWSAGAGESGFDIYCLMANSTDLVLQYGYKYDSYENEEEPWMFTYDGEDYETITEDEYNDNYDNMDNCCERFEYEPLSEFVASDAGSKASAEKKTSVLPPYEYTGPELFYTVLFDYLIDEFAENYPDADVSIPCPVIIAEDAYNQLYSVYGDFWIFNYDKNGDILECESGGSYPGVMHIRSTDTGYEVEDMEIVEDGSNYTDSAKKIFGDHYKEFTEITEEDREYLRGYIIKEYVDMNGLDITAYKDYGWDPVKLPDDFLESFYGNI
ncbi:MAG: hypothetical protein K6G22_02240 [Lachnospiraceae bacterium]|nr:hypothetical protein [Lachnospiraceae bacterium]